MKYMIMMFGSAAEMTETQSPEWITEMIGFWVLDVADEARILEIAGKIVKYSRLCEVRPVGVAPDLA